VITDPELYFPRGQDWVRVFYVWDGGLGIWGAIALGGLGAWIGARRRGVKLPPFADAVAPGIVLAQAMGRWGNWFNNELYGKKTGMPWGLQVHVMDPSTQAAIIGPDGKPTLLPGLYQPTFLYESLWCVGVAALVIWADRKFTLGYGRAFALYVAAYTIGRGWIEYLRIDEAHHILGLRLNDWTAIVVFVGAVVYFVRTSKSHPGRETTPYLKPATDPDPVVGAGATAGSDEASDAPIGHVAPEPDNLETGSPEAGAAEADAGGTDEPLTSESTSDADSEVSEQDPHPHRGSGSEPEEADEAEPVLTTPAKPSESVTRGHTPESST
jgi:prolipoprotein diacylglyceryl transferase